MKMAVISSSVILCKSSLISELQCKYNAMILIDKGPENLDTGGYDQCGNRNYKPRNELRARHTQSKVQSSIMLSHRLDFLTREQNIIGL